MKKLKVGQKVIVVPCGNAARYNSNSFEAEVKNVERKYFSLISEYRYLERYKFSFETMKDCSIYSANYRVYINEEEYSEAIEKPKLISDVQNLVLRLNYSQIKEINETINNFINYKQ